MDSKLPIEICVPMEATKRVTLGGPTSSTNIDVSLGKYEIQRQRNIMLIQDLQVGGAGQAKHGSNWGIIQSPFKKSAEYSRSFGIFTKSSHHLRL